MATRDNSSIEALELHLRYVFEHKVNFKTRTILLNQEIDEASFTLIELALSEMEAHSRQPIIIRINSDGGSTYDALAIVGRMRRSKCKIITEGYGKVQSCATLILAAGKLRRFSHIATFMHHESSYALEKGKHSGQLALVSQFEKEEKLWAECMARFSKKPVSFYLKAGKYVDKYWTPEQLIEFGIVDELI